MLVKWIHCHVEEHYKGQFSAAQEKWCELEQVPGFLMQLGGWNEADSNEACTLSLWENEQAYAHFMKEVHDVIYEKSRQKGTYGQISVSVFTAEPLDNSNFTQNQSFIQMSRWMLVGRAGKEANYCSIINNIREEIANTSLIETVVLSRDQSNYVMIFLSEKITCIPNDTLIDYTIVKLQAKWSVFRKQRLNG